MRRLSLTLPLVLLAVALALPAEAGAVIQSQQGISGVRLGMTQARVKESLGNPAASTTGTNDFGPFTQFRYAGGMRVTFQGNTSVTGVSVSGRTDRTSRGVGVGSTETTVKKLVSGVTCETIGGSRSCHVGAFTAGNRVTDFLMRKGRVRRVTVAIVID